MSTTALARAPRADGSTPKNPVHAGSLPVGGEWERAWHCTLTAGEIARVRHMASVHRRRLAAVRRARKTPSERALLAVPSKNGLDILAALASMAAGLVGKRVRLLAASYRELANRADCSVETVRRQIAVLRRAGLLRWQRRCRRTEAPAEFGLPQWEQAENVYELVTPAGVKREHKRAGAEVDRRRAQAAAAAAATQQASTGAHRPSSPLAKGLISQSLAEALQGLRSVLQHETGKVPERPGHQAFEEKRR